MIFFWEGRYIIYRVGRWTIRVKLVVYLRDHRIMVVEEWLGRFAGNSSDFTITVNNYSSFVIPLTPSTFNNIIIS